MGRWPSCNSAFKCGRVPRVARLLSLVYRFGKLIRDGEVHDYSDLARLGHVTRARVTQIKNLLSLAPDIQESILCWPGILCGDDPTRERQLRSVVAEVDWHELRRMWATLRVDGDSGPKVVA